MENQNNKFLEAFYFLNHELEKSEFTQRMELPGNSLLEGLCFCLILSALDGELEQIQIRTRAEFKTEFSPLVRWMFEKLHHFFKDIKPIPFRLHGYQLFLQTWKKFENSMGHDPQYRRY